MMASCSICNVIEASSQIRLNTKIPLRTGRGALTSATCLAILARAASDVKIESESTDFKDILASMARSLLVLANIDPLYSPKAPRSIVSQLNRLPPCRNLSTCGTTSERATLLAGTCGKRPWRTWLEGDIRDTTALVAFGVAALTALNMGLPIAIARVDPPSDMCRLLKGLCHIRR